MLPPLTPCQKNLGGERVTPHGKVAFKLASSGDTIQVNWYTPEDYKDLFCAIEAFAKAYIRQITDVQIMERGVTNVNGIYTLSETDLSDLMNNRTGHESEHMVDINRHIITFEIDLITDPPTTMSGWLLTGEISDDYYEWCQSMRASKGARWVNLQDSEITASSLDSFKEFWAVFKDNFGSFDPRNIYTRHR